MINNKEMIKQLILKRDNKLRESENSLKPGASGASGATGKKGKGASLVLKEE